MAVQSKEENKLIAGLPADYEVVQADDQFWLLAFLEVPTGESRRNTKKIIMSNLATAGVVSTANKAKNKKTTKSNTKTYAQMVKEDKEKGKNKVLSRRAPEPPPRKPKKLRDKPVEKKFNLKKGGKGSAQQRLKEIEKEKKGKK